MSVSVREGQSIPPEMAGAMGIHPPQHQPPPAANPNAGWMQNGPQPTGAVYATASAPIGPQHYQPPAAPPPAPPQQQHMSGLAALGALASGQSIPRRVKWFTFPSELWADMPDVRPEHRKFAIKHLTVPEEQKAQANASGTNFMAALSEMAVEAVKRVGDLEAHYDVKQGMAVYGAGGWWEAIGSKGRRLVETAYHDVNQPASALGESMVADAQDGWA
jgi:hypothetical protein